MRGPVLVLGVCVFFLLFATAQERLYGVVDKNGKKFDYFMFPVFIVTCSNLLLSFCILSWNESSVRSDLRSYAATWFYKKRGPKSAELKLSYEAMVQILLTSFSYVVAMLSSNFALTQVSFPVQVIFKSTKMVPVLLGGHFIFGQRYTIFDYMCVIVVSVSLVTFNFSRNSGGSGNAIHITPLGFVSLALSLMCDAHTGPRQDNVLRKHQNLDAVELMFVTNFFAVIWVTVLMTMSEGLSPFRFVLSTPDALLAAGTMAVCGSLGQVFVFRCLRAFGSLRLSLLTTTRKFFSVLLSVLVFRHTVTFVQWVCIAHVFGAITIQHVNSKRGKIEP